MPGKAFICQEVLDLNMSYTYVSNLAHTTGALTTELYEPRHEKTNVLHMRKQRRRLASRQP